MLIMSRRIESNLILELGGGVLNLHIYIYFFKLCIQILLTSYTNILVVVHIRESRAGSLFSQIY